MKMEEGKVVRAVPYQVIANMNSAACSLSIEDEKIEKFLIHHGIKRRATSFSFVNRADHYFFYRKPHEHIPGIMLLEAARQAIYYQLYTYSGHNLGKVTVSLRELNAKFYAYGELMYPIEVVVDDLTEGDDHFPKEVHYSVSFYQRGSLIARINSLAPVIPLNRFVIARNACLCSERERFSPLPSAPLVSLFTASDMHQEIVSVQEVGMDTCITSLPKTGSLTQTDGFLTITYDGNLCFSAPITKVSEDETSVTWCFGQVKYSELEQLKEIIKRGFVLSETYAEAVQYDY